MPAPLLGDVIKDARLEHGWTQTELAQQLGVGKAVVSRWEKNNRLPGVNTMRKLAHVLEIDPNVLQDLGTGAAAPIPPRPDIAARRLAQLVGELADPMAIEMLECFRRLGPRQRKNVLDLVKMAIEIGREMNEKGHPSAPLEAMPA